MATLMARNAGKSHHQDLPESVVDKSSFCICTTNRSRKLEYDTLAINLLKPTTPIVVVKSHAHAICLWCYLIPFPSTSETETQGRAH